MILHFLDVENNFVGFYLMSRYQISLLKLTDLYVTELVISKADKMKLCHITKLQGKRGNLKLSSFEILTLELLEPSKFSIKIEILIIFSYL